MKGSTNHREKLPRKIISTVRSEPGAIAEIARSVVRADGKRGVSMAIVSQVLALKKRSRRVEVAIARKAAKIARRRCFEATGRIDELARRFAG